MTLYSWPHPFFRLSPFADSKYTRSPGDLRQKNVQRISYLSHRTSRAQNRGHNAPPCGLSWWSTGEFLYGEFSPANNSLRIKSTFSSRCMQSTAPVPPSPRCNTAVPVCFASVCSWRADLFSFFFFYVLLHGDDLVGRFSACSIILFSTCCQAV